MQEFSGYISYAPFPEGFTGDMDETFQQSGQLAIIYISGNFLTGLYYEIGTVPPALPTSDQGPIAMNGQWYFWDPVSGQYLPQSSNVKVARNYCKNPIYQVQQLGSSFTISATGVTKLYDLAQVRATQAGMLSVASASGAPASADNDNLTTAIKYTVGPGVVATLAATDLFAHEHLIEGIDLAGTLGQVLSLSFDVMVTQTGTYSVYLTSNGRDMSYVFSFTMASASAWTRIKVNNIPALPTGTGTWNFSEGNTGLYIGVVMGIGSQYQTATPNKWVSGFYGGTSANTNMIAVSNNQITITGVKLETSPTATYMTATAFDNDYWDCIRYYWTSFSYQSLTSGFPFIMQSQSANNAFGSLLFERRMCRAPSVVPYGWTSHAAGNVTNISSNTDVPTATLPSTGKGVGGSIAATSNKGDTFGCLLTADARLS